MKLAMRREWIFKNEHVFPISTRRKVQETVFMPTIERETIVYRWKIERFVLKPCRKKLKRKRFDVEGKRSTKRCRDKSSRVESNQRLTNTRVLLVWVVCCLKIWKKRNTKEAGNKCWISHVTELRRENYEKFTEWVWNKTATLWCTLLWQARCQFDSWM